MNLMRRSMKMMFAVAALALVGTTGCRSTMSHVTKPAVETPMIKAVSDGKGMTVADGMVRGTLYYPTGNAATSALMLEKAQPAEVIAGKPYTYEMTVKNLTGGKLENIELTESIPAGLKLGDSLEGATLKMHEGKALIGLGSLEAGESKTLKIPATATQGGATTSCASVTYSTSLCLGLNVVSPALKLTKTLPAETLVCNDVPMQLTVTNTGTGTARNVKLEDVLPEGMVTKDGKTAFNVNLGNVAAGETKKIELPLSLKKTGTFVNTVKVTGDDGLSAEATATTIGRKPLLVVEKTGPKQVFVGVPFNYEILVTNKGDAPAANTMVTDSLPAGLVATAATDGGMINDGKVSWNMGTLPVGESKKLGLTVRGDNMTAAKNTVTATASCAEPATVSAETQLVGIPAILLEVTDNPDPVIVGSETTYTIVVTNQGSALATNVKIVCDLEEQMEFISATGVTNGTLEGSKITFEPLASLAAKAKAPYTVKIKAKSEADVRFKVTLTSDQIKRTVEETESSNFYK